MGLLRFEIFHPAVMVTLLTLSEAVPIPIGLNAFDGLERVIMGGTVGRRTVICSWRHAADEVRPNPQIFAAALRTAHAVLGGSRCGG